MCTSAWTTLVIVLHKTFSGAKMFELWLIYHWCFYSSKWIHNGWGISLTSLTSHYFNQCCSRSMMLDYNGLNCRDVSEGYRTWTLALHYKSLVCNMQFSIHRQFSDFINGDYVQPIHFSHICFNKIISIGLDNPGILLIEPLGTKFYEFCIKMQYFSFKKMH